MSNRTIDELFDFVLINLGSQYEAVLKHINGWQPEEIIDWMKTFGTVIHVQVPHDNRAYIFYSASGLASCFRFTEDDALILVR